MDHLPLTHCHSTRSPPTPAVNRGLSAPFTLSRALKTRAATSTLTAPPLRICTTDAPPRNETARVTGTRLVHHRLGCADTQCPHNETDPHLGGAPFLASEAVATPTPPSKKFTSKTSLKKAVTALALGKAAASTSQLAAGAWTRAPMTNHTLRGPLRASSANLSTVARALPCTHEHVNT